MYLANYKKNTLLYQLVIVHWQIYKGLFLCFLAMDLDLLGSGSVEKWMLESRANLSAS